QNNKKTEQNQLKTTTLGVQPRKGAPSLTPLGYGTRASAPTSGVPLPVSAEKLKRPAIGVTYGYHHRSHYSASRCSASRRRLVRPWTLVLGVASRDEWQKLSQARAGRLSPSRPVTVYLRPIAVYEGAACAEGEDRSRSQSTM